MEQGGDSQSVFFRALIDDLIGSGRVTVGILSRLAITTMSTSIFAANLYTGVDSILVEIGMANVVNFGGGGRCGGAFLLWLETSWFVKLAGCWTGGAGGGFVGLPAISVVNFRQYLRSRQRQFLSLLLWPESRYGLDQIRGLIISGGEWRLRLQVYFATLFSIVCRFGVFAVSAIMWSRFLELLSEFCDSVFDLGEVKDWLLKASSVTSDFGNHFHFALQYYPNRAAYDKRNKRPFLETKKAKLSKNSKSKLTQTFLPSFPFVCVDFLAFPTIVSYFFS